jgi:hypothetical protein
MLHHQLTFDAFSHGGVQCSAQASMALQKMICTVWNLWKEHCRRVFDNMVVQPNVLANAVKLDVQWCVAWNGRVGSIGAALYEDVT